MRNQCTFSRSGSGSPIMIRVRSDDVGEVEYAAPESITPEVGEVRWKRTFMLVARCMCEASSLPARAKTIFLSLVFAVGMEERRGGVYLPKGAYSSSLFFSKSRSPPSGRIGTRQASGES